MAVERLKVVERPDPEKVSLTGALTVAPTVQPPSMAPDPVISPPVMAAAPPPTEIATSLIIQQTIGVIAAVTVLTAVRLWLLLALVGAFVLAVMAMQAQTIPALAVMVAYAVLVLIPMVYLQARPVSRA